MITTTNYYSKTKSINWSAVPASLRKTHETLIPDVSKNDWQVYHTDEDVKRVVEKYFAYIGKFIPSADQSAPVEAEPGVLPAKTNPKSKADDNAERAEARKLTMAFLRPYVERGETLEQINKSYLGSSNKAGSFQVKSNRILVDRIAERSVNYVFPLKSIFDEIKGMTKEKRSSITRAPAKKTKAVAPLPEPKQVVFIPTATAFIKRYVGLHGKTKSYDQILSLTHGLQKAMAEQRIKASDPARREIEKMQTELIALVTKMGGSAKIEIPEPYLSHYKQVAQGEEVRASVKLLKQFIRLNGKKPEKAKAQKLGAKLWKALDEIPKEDVYRPELSTASTAISRYVKGETSTIDIPVATLHGLGAISIGTALSGLGTIGQPNVMSLLPKDTRTISPTAMKRAFRDTANPSLCYDIACAMIRRRSNAPAASENRRLSSPAQDDGISGLDVMDWKLSNAVGQDSGVQGLGAVHEGAVKKLGISPSAQPTAKTEDAIKPISAQDLAKLRFKTIGYHGRFKDVIGDPAIGFHMMVYGKPFQGKSSFVIELCKDLATLKHGRVAYLALEEGISASMQKKVIDRGAADVSDIDFIGTMIPSFEGYRFVVIDSVSDRSLKRETLRELFLKNPDVCFICIFHATKEGTARGGLDYSHDMDIILRVDGHVPFVEKNRFI